MKRVLAFLVLWVVALAAFGCEKKVDREAADADAAVAEGSRGSDAEPDEMQGKDDQKKEIPEEAEKSE